MIPIEVWQDVGKDGHYEILVELESDESVPTAGGEVNVPGLGKANVHTVLIRRRPPASSEPRIVRMDVWLTPR